MGYEFSVQCLEFKVMGYDNNIDMKFEFNTADRFFCIFNFCFTMLQ